MEKDKYVGPNISSPLLIIFMTVYGKAEEAGIFLGFETH